MADFSLDQTFSQFMGVQNTFNSGTGTTGNLIYPSDLDTTNYYMAFQFVQYQRPNIFARGFTAAQAMVALPLPMQLVDSQQVSYDESSSSPAVGATIEGMISGATSATATAANVLGSLASGTGGAAAGLVVQGGENSAAAVGTNLNQVLSLSGMAVNPFLSVLFNSPKFKRHAFSWTFMPSNSNDTNAVANITNLFKYHSLPGISTAAAGTLLSYPDILYISIYPDNNYLYHFKPCVIEEVKINYSADGYPPAFFGDTKGPSSVTMSISLLEIEYHLKSDWTVNNNVVKQNVIGT